MKQLLIGIGWFTLGLLILFGVPWHWESPPVATESPNVSTAVAVDSAPDRSFVPGKTFPTQSSVLSQAEAAVVLGPPSPVASPRPHVVSVAANQDLEPVPAPRRLRGGPEPVPAPRRIRPPFGGSLAQPSTEGVFGRPATLSVLVRERGIQTP